MTSAVDVAVVGGGPVGLATALAARRQGLSVTLFERARPPVDKACGEGLMPSGVAALDELGIQPPPRSFSFSGIRYVGGATTVEGDFPDGACGLGLRRTELSSALASAAAAAGVKLRWGERVERAAPGRVETARGSLACRYLVGADGLHSRLRALLGPRERAPRRAPSWRFGVRRHLRLAPWSARVEVIFGERAEAYVTPLAPDEIGVAILWKGGTGGFDRLLSERLPKSLRDRLAGASRLGRDLGAGPFRQKVRRIAGTGIALVGDAAGYVDALTGEGLSMGFAEALALGRALASGDLPAYAREVRRLRRLPETLTRLLLAIAARPRLRERWLAALAVDRALFSRLLGVAGLGRPLATLGAGAALRHLGRMLLPG